MKAIKYVRPFLVVICVLFLTNRALSQDFITPVVNCVIYDEISGNYIAHFGYINESDNKIVIEEGKENKLTPNKYKGPVTEFLPGTHSFVFSVEFNGSDLTWHIDSDPIHVKVKSTTANEYGLACTTISSIVTDIDDGTPIPNVKVLALNSQIETQTAADGSFELGPVSADDTLQFTLAGYLPLTVPVASIDTSPVLLQKEIKGLEPVFASVTEEGDNLWPELYYLADQNELGNESGSNEIFQIDSTVNTVLIEIWAVLGADIPTLRNLLVGLGLKDEILGGSSLLITGWFPIENLKQLNNYDDLISFVRPVITPISSQGLVTTEGDSVMKTNWVRTGYSIGGAGVKIGVLSDSYDASGEAAASIVANGDLPGSANSGNLNPVQVLKDSPRGSNEGMGMLEIIHDVAPQADLGFRTGFLSPGDMANGIKELADAGYDVIVDDITYLTEPFKPKGQIAQSVAYAAGKGVHYLTSAGNFGDRSFGAKFNPSASPLPFAYLSDANTYAHDFGGGDIFQQISLEPGVYIMELQWDDLFYSQGELPGASYDMDIWVVDGLGNLLYSGNRFNTGEDPIEITAFRITEPITVNIMITGSDIPAGLDFQYVVFRGNGWDFREFGANSSTVIGHASSPALTSVGAIFYGFTPEFTNDSSLIKTNPYSSRGGNVLGSLNSKPDFVTTDGANTSSFGSDIQFDADNFPNFFGTSAAAPHAAGLMAVILEAYDRYYDNSADAIKNEISSSDLRNLLAANSLDIDEGGVDNISGAGLIDARATLATLANATPQNPRILVTDSTVVPGKETFTLTITGDYLSENTELLLRGEPLAITNKVALNDITTQIEATVDPFVGNPPLNLYTPSKEGTNGTDGGLSDSVFFFTPQIQTITISVTDTTKKYGEVLPAFSYTVAPALSVEELALLPEVQFETNANSLSDVGPYFAAASFGLDTEGNPIEAPAALQELYEFVFDNGALVVEPLLLTVTPNNQTITYGDPLNPITFTYSFEEGYEIPYADSVLTKIQWEHGTQLVQDTVAILSRSLSLVNRSLSLVNNTSWVISESALFNRSLSLVNGLNVVEFETSLLDDYYASPSGTLVNRSLSLVNSTALANGEGFLSFYDESGNLTNRSLSLVNRSLSLVNRSLSLVNDAGEESSMDSTIAIVDETDTEIDFISINLVTGLHATAADESHYILPGAYYAKNFIVNYNVGTLTVNKAPLTIAAKDTVINEFDPVPPFKSTVEGFLMNDTYDSVFAEAITPSYTISPNYSGEAGLYDIIPSIQEPMNYYMVSQNGYLYVNPTVSGNKIKIYLECHEQLKDDPSGNTNRAYFSYTNSDAIAWYLPVGDKNNLVGITNYTGELPALFLPGKHYFHIDWDGSKMNWQVNSTSIDKTSYGSSENVNSEGCSSLLYTKSAETTTDYSVYPNPTYGLVTIDFNNGSVATASFAVFDSYGNPLNVSVIKDEFNNSAQIDFTLKNIGTYYVLINNGTNTTIRINKE